jgi:hypothetical protein
MSKFLTGLGFVLSGLVTAWHPHCQYLLHTNITLRTQSPSLSLAIAHSADLAVSGPLLFTGVLVPVLGSLDYDEGRGLGAALYT